MRAGSKRLKNKNVRRLAGKPLYEHMIGTLLAIKKIDKIILNTDIPAVIRKYRGKQKFIILKRKQHLRGNCNINRVIEDTLRQVGGEHFLQTHVTSPLMRADTIRKAIKTYFSGCGRHDSLFSVTRLRNIFGIKTAKH